MRPINLKVLLAHNMIQTKCTRENKEREKEMKVDYIVKNASIYTSNKDALKAEAFAVKDGKFVYVGDEAGLADYEGEVKDMQGRFVIPGLIDSHIHLPAAIALTARGELSVITVDGKAEVLKFIKDFIEANPGKEYYDFLLDKMHLGADDICYEDLDEICVDAEIYVREAGGHSMWVNGTVLKNRGIDDSYVDPVPNQHYLVRDEKGHITGCMFEGPYMKIMMEKVDSLDDAEIERQLQMWIDFSKKVGVAAAYEAGTPGNDAFTERVYKILCRMDKEGKLPIYVEGSYMAYLPDMIDGAIDKLIHLNKECTSEHVRVRTLKILLDGTMNIQTSFMVEPFVSGKNGGRIVDEVRMSELIIRLNELGFDLHVHTVGDGASKTVLDAVELARKALGDNYHTRVTSAHLEVVHESSLKRFGELGVITNFTPFWHGAYDARPLGEERAQRVFSSRTIHDAGALFTCSTDNIAFGDFSYWNPLLGIEVGITRLYDTNSKVPEYMKSGTPFPPATECMTLDQMLQGFTINNAYQLYMEDRKGSIQVGKDADFLVYEEDFFKRELNGLSQLEPVEVYFSGKLI